MKAVTAVCFALICALGAANMTHHIVGKWSRTAHDLTFLMTLGPHGEYSMSIKGESKGKRTNLGFTGTYRLVGKKLIIQITSQTSPKLTSPRPPDQATIKWRDDDHLFIAGEDVKGDGPLFSRVK